MSDNVPTGVSADRPARPRPPRWGVRTVWFVGFALLCMLVANGLYAAGIRGWGLLPFIGVCIGIVGGAYTSYRGLRSASWLPR